MKLKRSLLLILCSSLLLGGCMTSCRKDPPSSDETQAGTSSPSDTEGSTTAESETEGKTEFVEPTLVGPYADTIMLSNRLADGVQAYYANPKRTAYRIENRSMSLEYTLSSAGSNLVTWFSLILYK